MVNMNINDDVKNVLTEIYNYSHTGLSSKDLEAHITSHQENLSQWVEDIDSFS